MIFPLLMGTIRYPAFGDDDPPPADPPPADPPPADPPPADDPPPDPPPKLLTQEEFNRALADDRRKHQEQTKKALAEVDALRSKAKLTQQERDDLDKRYQKMQSELLTKEELAAQEQTKLKKEHQTKLSEVTSDRDSWKDRFTNSAIRRSITDAAAKLDAYNPSQIVALLQPQTRLVEVRDTDGNLTGAFKPEIEFDDINEKGEPVTLTLTPEKAVKRMKEKEDSMNLFKGTGVGGLGENNQPSGKKPDAKKLAQDAASYREARSKGQLKFT